MDPSHNWARPTRGAENVKQKHGGLAEAPGGLVTGGPQGGALIYNPEQGLTRESSALAE